MFLNAPPYYPYRQTVTRCLPPTDRVYILLGIVTVSGDLLVPYTTSI